MASIDHLKSLDKTLLTILGLTTLNFWFDFFIEYKLISSNQGMIYGIVAGVLLISLYSIKFFRKREAKAFDYLKLTSIFLISSYPFVFLYSAEPWPPLLKVICFFIPASIFFYDKFILNPKTTTRQLVIFSVIQTVLLGLFIIYSLLLADIAKAVERKRLMEHHEALKKIEELKTEIENCKKVQLSIP